MLALDKLARWMNQIGLLTKKSPAQVQADTYQPGHTNAVPFVDTLYDVCLPLQWARVVHFRQHDRSKVLPGPLCARALQSHATCRKPRQSTRTRKPHAR